MSLLDKFQRELVAKFAKLEEKYFHQIKLFSNCKKYIFNWVKYKPTKSSAPRWTTSHSWSPTSIILQGSHPPSQIENCNWCIITTKQSSLAKALKQIQLAGRIFKELLVGQKLYSSKVFYIVLHSMYTLPTVWSSPKELLSCFAGPQKIWSFEAWL